MAMVAHLNVKLNQTGNARTLPRGSYLLANLLFAEMAYLIQAKNSTTKTKLTMMDALSVS
jgi:hypothetical protein